MPYSQEQMEGQLPGLFSAYILCAVIFAPVDKE